MRLTAIQVTNFKRLANVPINLRDINLVVGGNNAGKSSLLQAIHFAVSAAVAGREQGETTFAADSLTYLPAADFVSLRHGQPYQNSTDQPFSGVVFSAVVNEELAEYKISIRRGRNYGNISCDRDGNYLALGSRITDSIRPFSIYVPGLAGVPQFEEFRPKRAVVRGVASGDANLYLRNVLHLLKLTGRLDGLVQWMRRLFTGFALDVRFDTEKDTRITVSVTIANRSAPLELVGTGVQQALQIFSYVCLFEPLLLLLDEPDSHLHPTNQYALAEALKIVASESQTCVLASTHSKHLVDALYGDANLIWLRDGQLAEQGVELSRLSLLMDLGALDTFDKLGNGEIDFVVLSEDTHHSMLKTVLASSGFAADRTLVFSYKTSSSLYSAYLLVDFIRQIAPNSRVIIHRDRDFMTDAEVQFVSAKIALQGAQPFITRWCDIEAYYCQASHVATPMNQNEGEVADWISELIQEDQISTTHTFTTKRAEIRQLFYRQGQILGDPPATLTLLGGAPFAADKVVGKYLLKKIRARMHSKFGQIVDLTSPTASLDVPEVRSLLQVPVV